MLQPRWLRAKEVADLISKKTQLEFNTDTIRGWMKRGRISPSGCKVLLPSVIQLGRRVVWSEWLDKFIEEANQ